MPKKSIRLMNRFERMHYSLKARVFHATIMGAILVGAVALLVGLALYTWSLISQYIGESYGLVRSTAAAMDEKTYPDKLSDSVMQIYSQLSEEELRQTGTEEYRERFADIVKRDDYIHLKALLGELRDASNASYLYVGMYDRERNALVYICDPDDSEETLCFPGDWESVEGEELDKFFSWDGQSALYDIGNTDKYGWMCTSGIPLNGEDGEICCFILADILMADVLNGIKTFVLQFTISIVIVVLLLGWILSRRMQKQIVAPINAITDAAQKYIDDCRTGESTGEHFSRLEIHTGDEIENLCVVMDDMEQGLFDYAERLTEVTAEKERISTELELATRIQEGMLPSTFPAFPDRTEFDIYASMLPAREVGGDFYDYFLIDDDHLAMVMADVSGKGIPAALFMMASKIIIKNNAMSRKSPAEILRSTNNAICSNNRNDMFVTVWVGILQISTGVITAANAGHEYPVIKRADGEFELFKDKHGFVLGGMPDMKYTEYQFSLRQGDRLFLYTDGVPEATDANGAMFGIEKMKEALNSRMNSDPKAILEGMSESINEFTGDTEQFDDITMLCLEIRQCEAPELPEKSA